MSKAITVRKLDEETTLDRWDKDNVPVKARFGVQEFLVVGLPSEAGDVFMLELEGVEPDYEPIGAPVE